MENQSSVLGDGRRSVAENGMKMRTKMKSRFRISIRKALLCVAIIAVGTRWWQTVPGRTVGRFADAIVNRDPALLDEFGEPGRIAFSIASGNGMLQDKSMVLAQTVPQHRGFADLLIGRAMFTISLSYEDGEEFDRLHAEVSRYRVLKLWSEKEHRSHSFLLIAMSN